ncbi:hypothetical protein [Vibrio phage JSF12]|uniref:Uncharacterized protein n=3 Tax=Jesfedecavirus TaxID=2560156 RepID=A0A2D0Z8A2_9CAUD|nr:hypothetical protein AVV29_gp142 [Vibrio phage phi 3]YP_009618425.1 hypothetical protein FDI98_gp134 [Vibrio phage JSF10]YP_009794714.1 hypothetical protein HOS35_gp031 [Vibrio phage JSF12]AJF40836.1 hypothetical protein SBVP3_0069 [Vibrio phage phi 3]ASV43398.1 hypothetical protein [Vibrio phage JSF10]ASV43549.1 hypothetical protein [Vibrio phage JSF12]
MKTEKLLKLATDKVFVVNRFKKSQDKLRQQCYRLVKSGRLQEVEKTNEQVMFRCVRDNAVVAQ